MTKESGQTTLQDIANKTGYGRSTISLALRNDASIPQKTREKIQKAAEELNYMRNPLISALMAQIRDKRKKKREQIAVISRFQNPLRKLKGTYYLELLDAIKTEAQAHGYDLVEFNRSPTEPLSGSRLNDILITRGIHGVILFPGGSQNGEVDFPELKWENFATVLIGYNTAFLSLHQVNSDYAYDLQLALRHGEAGGFRRIGLVVSELQERLSNYGWTSHYLLKQSYLPSRSQIPVFRYDENAYEKSKIECLKWIRKHKPDLILTSDQNLAHWIKEAGYHIPGDISIILLIHRGAPNLAGIDPFTSAVGKASIEQLDSLLQTNQRGLPAFPRNIAIKGSWVPGESFKPITNYEEYKQSMTASSPEEPHRR